MSTHSTIMFESQKHYIWPDKAILTPFLGCFGVVWLGKCRGDDVAIKILHSQELEASVLQEFEKEVSFMWYVN